MPSLDLLLYFQDDLTVKDITYLNGMTYSQTLEAWLKNMDQNHLQIKPLFKVSAVSILEFSRLWFRTRMARKAANGLSIGVCSIWHAVSCLVMMAVRNGALHMCC